MGAPPITPGAMYNRRDVSGIGAENSHTAPPPYRTGDQQPMNRSGARSGTTWAGVPAPGPGTAGTSG